MRDTAAKGRTLVYATRLGDRYVRDLRETVKVLCGGVVEGLRVGQVLVGVGVLGHPHVSDVGVATVDLAHVRGQTLEVAVPMDGDEVDQAAGVVAVDCGAGGHEVLQPGESGRGAGHCWCAQLDAVLPLQWLHLLLPDGGGVGGGDAGSTG